MQIHIVHSEELSEDVYQKIMDELSSLDGVVKFIKPEDNLLEWTSKELGIISSLTQEKEDTSNVRNILFKKCNSFRVKNSIPNTDVVVLLSDYQNSHNWLDYYDQLNTNNFCIHTNNWSNILYSDFFRNLSSKGLEDFNEKRWYRKCRYLASHLPILKEIIMTPLIASAFSIANAEREWVHTRRDNCLFYGNSFSPKHWRRFDSHRICSKCQKKLLASGLSPLILQQTIKLLEDNYKELYLFEYGNNLSSNYLSHVEINFQKQNLRFVDFKETEVGLSSIELCVYHFILNHPEGITKFDIVNKLDEYEVPYLKNELFEIYKYHEVEHVLSAKFQNRFEKLCYNIDSEMSTHISRINKKIRTGLGDKIAKPYLIKNGKHVPHLIPFNRSYLKIVDKKL